MKAIILAGGKGTRLSPYTTILPKPLMPIGDMPILEVLLRQLKAAGIFDVVLAVGHLSGLLRAFFQDGDQFGVNITYSYEQKPLGTAGPLSQIDNLDETFLVANGDILTTLKIQDLVAFHREQKAAATIAMHPRRVKIDLGVIHCDESNHIIYYDEKPILDYLVSMGIYLFEPKVKSFIPPGQYLDFPDLVKKLIASGERVCGYPFEGYWQDLGRPDDYEQASIDFDRLRDEFLPEEIR